MLLNSMLEGLGHRIITGDVNVEIKDVHQDSRKVGEGTLFLAIKGFKTDGHAYVHKAIDAGAKAVVLTQCTDAFVEQAKKASVTLVEVEDDRLAMSHLAARIHKNPSEKIRVIGLTGTNGKTSTSRIIGDLLNASGISTSVLGTIANRVGAKTYKASLTTPEPVELHTLFKRMVDDAVCVCVMEASSHALDLKRVDHVDFDYAVFTNLTEDHLDYHADFEAYYRAKSKLFYLANKGRLINTDDQYGKRLYEELCAAAVSKVTGAPVLSYGIDSGADIRARDIRYLSYGSEYTLVTPNGETRVHIPLPGRIYVYNTLAAFGVLHMMGISNEAIQRLSKEISMVPGRMEIVRRGAPVRVFVDYAHTPDALSNAIDIVRSMTDGKVITVFGCGGDRDRTKRPIMGEIAECKSDKIYVTSDNPRTENPKQIITEIVKGLKNEENAVIEPDRKRAIGLAISQANEGDIVLIAGKGHETYQDIDGVKYDFDDKKIALGFMNAEEKE